MIWQYDDRKLIRALIKREWKINSEYITAMFRIRSEGLAGQEVKCVQLNKSGHTEIQKEGGG